jgi:hypothetical protein
VPRLLRLTKPAQEGKAMYWESLRKGMTIVLAEREHSHDKLFAENIWLRVDDDAQMVDVSVDLNKGLRTRSKGVSTYIDASDLAKDLPKRFKSLKIDDNAIVDRMNGILKHIDFELPKVWRLHVALQGDYWFNVRPEYKRMHDYESLTFHVESVLSEHPPL